MRLKTAGLNSRPTLLAGAGRTTLHPEPAVELWVEPLLTRPLTILRCVVKQTYLYTTVALAS